MVGCLLLVFRQLTSTGWELRLKREATWALLLCTTDRQSSWCLMWSLKLAVKNLTSCRMVSQMQCATGSMFECVAAELEDGDYDNDQSESQSEVSLLTEQFEALHLESVCQPARRPRVCYTHMRNIVIVDIIIYTEYPHICVASGSDSIHSVLGNICRV